MKILLLEDDKIICEQIKSYFELNDHTLDYFCDGEDLLENAMLDIYDIFLFDINTPKKNGFETLKEIRSNDINTPIIYLTAQSDIAHIKEGYSLGCSDYIKKPFILEEVELRINQILYRDIDYNNILLIDDYSFNLTSMELKYKNEIVDLKTKEQSILYILIKNIGRVVKSETIRDYVWDDVVCDNTLRTQIKRIRAKIKDNFIINIRNVGYKIERYD